MSLSTIVVKVIGMLYKLPLNQIIDSQGFAYFNKAYAIYTVLLVVSTTGLPVAMSRMVSEANARQNGKQMQRIFHTALIAYLSIGCHVHAQRLVFHLCPRPCSVVHLHCLCLPRLLPGSGGYDSHRRQPDH